MASRIVDSDIRLLGELADYCLLTAKQAAYLLERNVRALQRRLDTLESCGLVERLNSPSPRKERGRPEQMYGIAKKGLELLVQRGILNTNLKPRHGTAESVGGQSFHQHLVNVFRLSLVELERQTPELAVQGVSSNSPFAMDPDSGRPSTRASVSSIVEGEFERAQFIPDFVFNIYHEEKAKCLLFFLEADTGTEPLSSSDPRKPSVKQKIRNYQEYFHSKGYKIYESRWDRSFNGYRLLFLCSDMARSKAVARTVHRESPSDFIWVTCLDEFMSDGVSGAVWRRGGKEGEVHRSILGSLARNVSMPF